MPYLRSYLKVLMSFTLFCCLIVKAENSAIQSIAGVVDRFYVGADNSCDFSTIQAGINAASSSLNPPEVLVADNKSYDENIFISFNNILIDGSYANCSDARNGVHGGNRVKVRGFPGFAIATIQITGLFVTIKNLHLDTNNSGGILANSTSFITLEGMLFFQLGNSAIKVEGSGQIDLTVKNSIFLLNSADRGAAISCIGSNHFIRATEGSGFANNTTTSHGGAVWLDEGCDFFMSDGGFQNNHTDGEGGGIHAFNSNVTLKNVFFSSNDANESGGAIFANETTINAENTRFINNQSEMFGGAIRIVGSTLSNTESIFKSNKESCTNLPKCSLFDGNKSSFGGAIYISSRNIDISSTYFENNRANEGTAIYVQSTGTIKVEGSVFIHNGNNAAGGYTDRNVIKADGNSSITYSTFADNKVLFGTLGLANSAFLSVYSSIIYDASSGNVFDIDSGSHDVNCLLVHESNSFNSNNAMVTVADPMFVDAANGDYHIKALSPAVDYCADTIAMAQYKDIDFQNRGFDDTDIPNNVANGIYDIGADEAYGDDIFKNGFED